MAYFCDQKSNASRANCQKPSKTAQAALGRFGQSHATFSHKYSL